MGVPPAGMIAIGRELGLERGDARVELGALEGLARMRGHRSRALQDTRSGSHRDTATG